MHDDDDNFFKDFHSRLFEKGRFFDVFSVVPKFQNYLKMNYWTIFIGICVAQDYMVNENSKKNNITMPILVMNQYDFCKSFSFRQKTNISHYNFF